MRIRKIASPEIRFVIIGFLLSLIHPVFCGIFFILLLWFFTRQGVVGCIKGLLIATTRGILSSAIAVEVSGVASTLKWILIFVFSLYILFNQKNEQPNHDQSIINNNLLILLGIFVVYSITASFITGSYPVISAFKIISYAIPFFAVIVGVSITNHKINWAEYCYLLLTPVVIASAIVIPFNRFKVVNDSFQGVVNHPNLFGIVGTIYICFLLNSYYASKNKRQLGAKRIILLVLTFVMIYLSGSRTGMFSSLVILLVYFVTINTRSKVKIVLGVAILATVMLVYFSINTNGYKGFADSVNKFITKHEETNSIFETREALMRASMNKFRNNNFLGSGFGAEYIRNVKSYEFSMNKTYESGNLYTTLLGDTGILGFGFFVVYMGYILLKSKPEKWILFFTPIIVSLGEMAFFSTNNIAIYYFVMLGICICNEKRGCHIAAEYSRSSV